MATLAEETDPIVCQGCGLRVEEYPEDHEAQDYCTRGLAPIEAEWVPASEAQEDPV